MRTLAVVLAFVVALLASQGCTHAGREKLLDAYRAEKAKPCPCEKSCR